MTRLQKHRKSACRIQKGLCIYCQCQMGADVTAEHLKARKDGGKDRKDNIVAACRECNHGRHADPLRAAMTCSDYATLRQLERLGLITPLGCTTTIAGTGQP